MMNPIESHTDKSRMKIMNLFGDGGRYAGLVNRTATHEMHFSRYFFDDYISLEPSGLLCWVDKEKINKTVSEVYSGKYTAAACDSHDALLLQFLAHQKRLPPLPFIINEVDCFEMVGWVRNFIKKHYRVDFFDRFVSARTNNWMYILERRAPLYISYGIKRSNLFYMPVCTAGIEFVFPDFFRATCVTASSPPPELAQMKDNIIAVGTHNRDYETLVRAVAGTEFTIHVITNLNINKPIESPNIVWHDSLPEPEFMQALRDAKMVVVPLKKNSRAAGQLACAVPMKFGKVVIASMCDSVSDHVIHNNTGLLYDPGSPASLRDVLFFAEINYAELNKMMENAQTREAELSKITAANIKRFFGKIRRKIP